MRGLTGSVGGSTDSVLATSAASLYAVTDNASYNAELSLYPNPATDVLIIALPNESVLGHKAELHDLLGRSVRAATLLISSKLSLASPLAPTCSR